MSTEKEEPSLARRTAAAIVIAKELLTGTPSLENTSQIIQYQASAAQDQATVTNQSELTQTPEEHNRQQQEESFKEQMQEGKAFNAVQQNEREQRKAELKTSMNAQGMEQETATDPRNKNTPESQQTASSSRIQNSVDEQKEKSGHTSEPEQNSASQEAGNTNDQQQKR